MRVPRAKPLLSLMALAPGIAWPQGIAFVQASKQAAGFCAAGDDGHGAGGGISALITLRVERATGVRTPWRIATRLVVVALLGIVLIG